MNPERATAILDELPYWKGLADDMRVIVDELEACSSGILEAMVAVLSTLMAPADQRASFALEATGHLNEAMRRLERSTVRLEQSAELVGGRMLALQREVDDA